MQFLGFINNFGDVRAKGKKSLPLIIVLIIASPVQWSSSVKYVFDTEKENTNTDS